MQNVACAYGDVARQTKEPRELEASLLVKSAAKLQSIKDSWSENRDSLDEALTYNKRLWAIFAAAMAEPENPLPIEIRNNIASLSVFIFDRTVELQLQPAPEKLTALITINREVAAGLRGIDAAEKAAVA